MAKSRRGPRQQEPFHLRIVFSIAADDGAEIDRAIDLIGEAMVRAEKWVQMHTRTHIEFEEMDF